MGHSKLVMNRRAFVQGVGVTMSLPWMESVKLKAADSSSKAANNEPPVRFACLFSGNGFHSKEWWA